MSRWESLHQAPLAYSILENKLWFPIFQVSALSAGWESFSSLIQLHHYPAASGELQQGMSPGKETSVGCRSCSLWLARWLWDHGLLRAESLHLSPCFLMNTWKASYLPWGTTAIKSSLANFCKARNMLPLPPALLVKPVLYYKQQCTNVVPLKTQLFLLAMVPPKLVINLTYVCPLFLTGKCNYSVGSPQILGHQNEVKVKELCVGSLEGRSYSCKLN